MHFKESRIVPRKDFSQIAQESVIILKNNLGAVYRRIKTESCLFDGKLWLPFEIYGEQSHSYKAGPKKVVNYLIKCKLAHEAICMPVAYTTNSRTHRALVVWVAADV